MKKINYNLARDRKIDPRSFALRLGVLLLALVLLNAVTVLNLSRLRKQERLEGKNSVPISQRMAEIGQKTQSRQQQIAVWKKTWERQLAFANALILRKRFSFVSRLDFLETVCGPGTLVRQLDIVNTATGRVQMTVSALAQNQLLRLYKKLLPYELAIANENQTAENYQARLSFRIKDENK